MPCSAGVAPFVTGIIKSYWSEMERAKRGGGGVWGKKRRGSTLQGAREQRPQQGQGGTGAWVRTRQERNRQTCLRGPSPPSAQDKAKEFSEARTQAPKRGGQFGRSIVSNSIRAKTKL